MHIQKHTCSSCGYPAAKTRKCKFSTHRISRKEPQITPSKIAVLGHRQHSIQQNTSQHRLKARTEMHKRENKTNTISQNSPMGREGQAQKDHWIRPHANSQGHSQIVQERFPHWCPQGCSWYQPNWYLRVVVDWVIGEGGRVKAWRKEAIMSGRRVRCQEETE